MYFVLRNDTGTFYTNLTKLCKAEEGRGLSYGNLSKHFNGKYYYENDQVRIWKHKKDQK